MVINTNIINSVHEDFIRKAIEDIDTYYIHVTQVIDLCQKEFVLSNIDRHYVIRKAPPHIYSLVGTLVHSYISDVLRKKATGDIESDDIEKYTRVIKGYEGDFLNSVNNFIRWYNVFINKVEEKGYKVYSEISTSKIVNDTDIYRLVLTGTSDLIVDMGDGKYEVIDFKTSKTTRMLNKYEEQMGGYKYLFGETNAKYGDKEIGKIDITSAKAVILGGDDYLSKPVNVYKGYNKFIKHLDDAISILYGIINGGDIQASISFRCAMCNFRSVCDGRNIYGNGEYYIDIL